MAALDAWLPPLLLQQDFSGWQAYEDALFNEFCNDFISNAPKIGKLRLGIESKPEVNGKHRTFWHLISEGAPDPFRTIDPQRCERIRWPRHMIVGFNSQHVCCWRNERKGEKRLLIALSDFRYVVVLAERRGHYFLWTAYCVKPWQRQQMQAEWQAYQADKAAKSS